MDTLISAGVERRLPLVPLCAVFWKRGASRSACTPASSCWPVAPGADAIYLDVAAGVTVLILTGLYLEARAKRRSGAALGALLSMGAQDVAVLRDGREELIPVEQLTVGDHRRVSSCRSIYGAVPSPRSDRGRGTTRTRSEDSK